MALILASASPRRKQLLTMLGLTFEVRPAAGEEKLPPGIAPEEAVKRLSAQKAAAVAETCAPGDVVIGADTVVWHGGRILGKPKTEQDAADMLHALSGETHTVYTGVTVLKDGAALSAAEETKVRFRSLPDGEIAAYIQTGEPMDKAGAYGAQGLGALFVEGIEGDFFNVMGLPVCRLGKLLKEVGVTLL
ncbi:MAG: septum formation inhibitor Maf [Oscillospiraceae bacterium]|jgi:septum formation protein|nr:septum formation inhibitor Maf [Oscillospiraceae bacterium]